MLYPNSRVLLLLFLYLFQPSAGTCYFRNRTEQSSDYSPCSSNSSDPLHSVCCARWDTCLPIGLCQSQIDKKLYREGCIKQNWDEGGCQELCSKEREVQKDDNVLVTPCGGDTTSTEWCCGSSDDCCSPGSDLPRYTLARKFGDPIPTSSRSSSSTPFMISSTSAPATSERTIPSRNGLSPGAKAGVGVGTAIGVTIFIGLGLFYLKAMQWRKMSKAAPIQAPAYELPEGHKGAEVYQCHGDVKAAQLAGMENAVYELPHSLGTHELSSFPNPSEPSARR
ncbi:hypothetical protein GQ44DRAFT_297559 [Phaeosphaeriaceae sp. PMI808]|nr:hypothetical protein GQ44DRAFT_297559 [Phaeosphaeriaceae sp. PMI808]